MVMRSDNTATISDKVLDTFNPTFATVELNNFVRLCQQYRTDYSIFRNTHDRVMVFILQFFHRLPDINNEKPINQINGDYALCLIINGLQNYLAAHHPNSKKLSAALSAYTKNNPNVAEYTALLKHTLDESQRGLFDWRCMAVVGRLVAASKAAYDGIGLGVDHYYNELRSTTDKLPIVNISKSPLDRPSL